MIHKECGGFKCYDFYTSRAELRRDMQKQCRNGYEEVRSRDSSRLRAEGHEKSSLQRNPKSWKKPFIAEGINLDDSLSSAMLQEQIWISLGRIPEHLKRGRLLGEQAGVPRVRPARGVCGLRPTPGALGPLTGVD